MMHQHKNKVLIVKSGWTLNPVGRIDDVVWAHKKGKKKKLKNQLI